ACRQLTPQQYAAEPAPGWSSVRASVVHITSATQNWAHRLAGEVVSTALTEADLPAVEDAERRLDQANCPVPGTNGTVLRNAVDLSSGIGLGYDLCIVSGPRSRGAHPLCWPGAGPCRPAQPIPCFPPGHEAFLAYVTRDEAFLASAAAKRNGARSASCHF